MQVHRLRTEDDFFNFAEFFRVWTDNEKADGGPMPTPASKGKFVHEEHVAKFLDMLCEEGTDSRYPYSTEQFRQALSHTLWMLPGVDAALALEDLIKEHRLCKELGFKTINVAGEGSKIEGLDEDDFKKIEKIGNDALKKVQAAIKLLPRTITLSCGRLTTGVSVPEWTGVFMLRGGYNVDAGNYMQTIFRGQTPYKNGVYNQLTPEYLKTKMALINESKYLVIDANITKECIDYLCAEAKVPIIAEPVSTAKGSGRGHSRCMVARCPLPLL